MKYLITIVNERTGLQSWWGEKHSGDPLMWVTDRQLAFRYGTEAAAEQARTREVYPRSSQQRASIEPEFAAASNGVAEKVLYFLVGVRMPEGEDPEALMSVEELRASILAELAPESPHDPEVTVYALEEPMFEGRRGKAIHQSPVMLSQYRHGTAPLDTPITIAAQVRT